MSKIKHILSSFSDTELAYLYKFKLNAYLPPTQESIKEYIFKQRGLDMGQIDDLVSVNATKQPAADTLQCPKCKSEKFEHGAGKIDCIVCGQTVIDFEDDEERSEFKEGFWELLAHIGKHFDS